MISRDQIRQLIERPANGTPILSAFLDMSVNSNNKRTFQVFLNKEKASLTGAESGEDGRPGDLGGVFAGLERWIGSNYDESKKGVAYYAAVDGSWNVGHQVSVPLPNRVGLSDRPVVGPLVEVIERYRHHGVVVVDREHLRLMSFFLDQALHERAVETEPHPTSHDVKRGGFSAADYQARKAEEARRHYFREFAEEVARFVRRHSPEDLILLGTPENVKKFREFLPSAVDRMVTQTDRVAIDATASEIRDRLAPFFQSQLLEEEARAVDRLRDRVRESHKAVAGPTATLEQLQGGKLETLVIARGFDQTGGSCSRCGFVLAGTSPPCPYCGGDVRGSVDLGEALLRIAEDQGLHIDLVEPSALEDLGGVGGLLRY
jgi:rubrerythrin